MTRPPTVRMPRPQKIESPAWPARFSVRMGALGRGGLSIEVRQLPIHARLWLETQNGSKRQCHAKFGKLRSITRRRGNLRTSLGLKMQDSIVPQIDLENHHRDILSWLAH
jgi:hypothetical protein